VSEPSERHGPSLSELFDAAVELSADELARFLADLATRDAARAAELQRLLAVRKHPEFDRFLSDPVDMVAAGLAAQGFIGRRIGPYVIDAELGRGGMGSVWRAHRADGRYEGVVAFKFVNAWWVGKAGEERFRLEGRLLAQLDHPNIARLLDAGILDGMNPYLVLEYVEGEPIDLFCQRSRFDVDARVRLFLNVLAAVSHAHRHLIVHRDLKPSNVLVARDGTVKLLDFGIAKLIDAGSGAGDASALTQDSGRALTPAYAAPEQILGRTVTTSSDVYALGVLLYVLLTGRHPVGAATASSLELSKAIVEADPPLPSEAIAMRGPDASSAEVTTGPDVSRLRRALRGDLDNIVAKALKKRPDERYESASAFADDLERYRRHEPVRARRDSLVYRAGKFVRRNRTVVVAGAVTSIAIVAGIIGTITQAQRAEDSALRAQIERDNALRELTYSEAADELMQFLLGESSNRPFTTADLLGRAEAQVERQFSTEGELRGRLQLTIANMYGELLDFKQAEAVLNRAQVSAQLGADPSLAPLIDCTLASLNSAIGQTERAPALLDDALRRLEASRHSDPIALADCHHERHIYYRDVGRAAESLQESLAALHYLGNPRPGLRAIAASFHSSLGDAYGMVGNFPLAIRYNQEALAGLAALGRERTVDALTTANNLGVHLSRAGQLLQAAEVYQRAFANLPPDSGVTRHLLGTNYAKALTEIGKIEESVPLFEDALRSATASGNERAIAFTSLYAASAWCAKGDTARCAALLETSRTTLPRVLPANHFVFGIQALTEARLATARHDLAGARRDLLRSLALFDAAPEKSPTRIRTLGLLARVEEELGDAPAASRHAQEAVVAARECTRGLAQSEWLGSALLALGVIEAQQGERAAARTAIGEALEQLRASSGEEAPATREAREQLARL